MALSRTWQGLPGVVSSQTVVCESWQKSHWWCRHASNVIKKSQTALHFYVKETSSTLTLTFNTMRVSNLQDIINSPNKSNKTDTYPHMPILRLLATRFHERRIPSVTFMSAHLYANVYMRLGVARWAGRFIQLWVSVGAKFTKICDSLPWTPMNYRAKFDASILALSSADKSVTVQTNKHTHTQKQ